jgi:heme/copper-type cytochrome/quinol oxidase subunit 1
VVTGCGALLVVAGVLVFATANRAQADFGWSAYTPLQESPGAYLRAVDYTFSDGAVLWTRQHLLGAGLVLLGLLVLTAAVAWLLGRRAGRRGTPPA